MLSLPRLSHRILPVQVLHSLGLIWNESSPKNDLAVSLNSKFNPRTRTYSTDDTYKLQVRQPYRKSDEGIRRQRELGIPTPPAGSPAPPGNAQQFIPTKEFNIDDLASAVERQPRMTIGRTFIDSCVGHMTKDPEKLDQVIWPALIARCKAMDITINDKNFGGILLSYCHKYENLEVGKSYLEWDPDPSLSALSFYIRLLALPGKEINEPEVFDLYEKIKVKNRGVWDIMTGERVIPALAQTSK